MCLFDTSLSHGTCFASERVGLRRVGFVLGGAHTYVPFEYVFATQVGIAQSSALVTTSVE